TKNKCMEYQQLILKSGRDKSILNRHPWIFSGGVKQAPKAKDGDVIAVADNHGKILGFGFYAPNSQIICRVFHFASEPEDFASLDFWMSKFEAAYALRKQRTITEQTNAYRLIHAEGDFLPGLIADVYANTAVVQLLIKGTERLQEIFVACLNKLGIAHVYFKSKSSS